MPRPRTVDDETILDAALALTQRLGPSHVTFAALAAEVGLSPATLVQRFATKRGLLLATARHATQRWTGPVEHLREGASLDAVIDALAGAAGDAANPGELAGSVAFLELDLRDAEFGALARAGAVALNGHLKHLLSTSGELGDSTDAAALAALLETVYHGAIIRWALNGESGALADAVRAQLAAALAPHRA